MRQFMKTRTEMWSQSTHNSYGHILPAPLFFFFFALQFLKV